jgi:aspartokinase/homoserine dehydrogenase 1
MPVLAMIRQIINSGDSIVKIEGIVSGTLNYLFSTYNAQKSFAQLVKEAKELGYTEPDPRLDLSGTDVMRKFLISAREAGERVEMADVEFKGFVPQELLQPKGLTFAEDEQEFYAGLEAEEVNLKAMYENAAAQGRKLRFAATLDKSGYRVGLMEVDSTHPFYSLEGSDNAMLITTEYYPNGVVIKGAGAGARQTASGLLNDILN